MLDVVKRESKLLIKIDLIDLALPYINISSVIYSTLDTVRNTFLNLRGSMKDKDLSKLITRTHECFEIAKELIDTLDLLAIIYIAHLGLWISIMIY